MSTPGLKITHPITDWGPTLTRQSEAKYADINLIMKKYEKTGVLPPATRQGFFADVSNVGDYRDALHRVQAADAYFMQLPAEYRKRFDNDPATFLDFVSDPDNIPELETMGLIQREPTQNNTPAETPADTPEETPTPPTE